jgi:hypothetical protein
MRYVCLIYVNEAEEAKIMQAEGDKVMGEYFTFTGDIQKSGHYKAGEALQPVKSATTLRSRGGTLKTTDGPFAETKEQLGGFYLIDAKDLNEAIQIASRIPAVRHGCVEVRPVVDFSQQ